MTERKLKKLLQQQSAQYLPSVEVKNRAEREIFGTQQVAVSTREAAMQVCRKRRGFLTICALILVCLAVVVVVVLNYFGSLDTNKNPGGSQPDTFVTKEQKKYAYSAFSAGFMLAFDPKVSTASFVRSLKAKSIDQQVFGKLMNSPFLAAEKEPDAQMMEKINRYLSMVDNFLVDSGLQFDTYSTAGTEYSVGIAMTASGLDGKNSTIIVLYNETVTADGKFSLTGEMRVGNLTYALSGERKEDIKGTEMDFVARIDEFNFVEVSQESEKGENEYAYSITRNGVKTEEFELEIETEGNHTEVEIASVGVSGNLVLEFKYMENNGAGHIQGTVKENGESFAFKVFYEETADGRNIYRYKFDSGLEFDKDKDDPFDVEDEENDKDDDKDDDDKDDDDKDDDDEDDKRNQKFLSKTASSIVS